ncbi:hypothetical protein EBT25_03545 [bacterium]|nr:hypothetical protein [bacterium]
MPALRGLREILNPFLLASFEVSVLCFFVMLYATFSNLDLKEISGHIGDSVLEAQLNTYFSYVTSIQADGHELIQCCKILGRLAPKRKIYTFVGANAQEIAANWKS